MPFHKAVRTLQSEFWFLKEAKDALYLHGRRLLHMPHEADFRAVRLIADKFAGSFIDVGANQGQSIESIRLFAKDARIVAFEPNPAICSVLMRRYWGASGIEVRGVGLSDRKTVLTLYVPSYRGFVYDGLASFDRTEALSWINPQRVLRLSS